VYVIEAVFTALMMCLTGFMVVRVFQRRASVALWESSAEGARQRRARGSWVRKTARVKDVALAEGPHVTEAAFATRTTRGRTRHVYEEHRRAPVRLVLEIPTEGGTVEAEATLTIRVTDLSKIDHGRELAILSDPGDPAQFWVDAP
jgi:hypothetical protein